MTSRELSISEICDFKAYLFMEFGKMNSESGWVMQLHIGGAVRDYRDKLFNRLGPDSGGGMYLQILLIWPKG